jgi:FkbM family methyltransferase
MPFSPTKTNSMDPLLFRKRVRALAAWLGILRPLRKLVFRLRGDLEDSTELNFLGRFVRPGCLVFDVGANRGQSSEHYIALGALVVAFEPQTDLHPQIRQLCANSRRLTIEACGLGSKEETRKFFLASYDQVASLRDDWEGSRIGETSIQVSTLDRQIARYGAPSYCKIDVEGWELEVLSGLSEPLALLSFEYHNSPAEIEKTYAILRRLELLGTYHYNIKEPGLADFALERFVTISEFQGKFASFLAASKENGYGDIFCALDPSRIISAQS